MEINLEDGKPRHDTHTCTHAGLLRLPELFGAHCTYTQTSGAQGEQIVCVRRAALNANCRFIGDMFGYESARSSSPGKRLLAFISPQVVIVGSTRTRRHARTRTRSSPIICTHMCVCTRARTEANNICMPSAYLRAHTRIAEKLAHRDVDNII